MHRARLLAVLILALLGAPVATHVLIHDLPDHHDAGGRAGVAGTEHGNHEHPVVASPQAAVGQVVRAALPLVDAIVPRSTHAIRAVNAERNVLAFGALRTDDDVGLHTLLSTFLI